LNGAATLNDSRVLALNCRFQPATSFSSACTAPIR